MINKHLSGPSIGEIEIWVSWNWLFYGLDIYLWGYIFSSKDFVSESTLIYTSYLSFPYFLLELLRAHNVCVTSQSCTYLSILNVSTYFLVSSYHSKVMGSTMINCSFNDGNITSIIPIDYNQTSPLKIEGDAK